MAQDKKKALDDKTRKLSNEKIEQGKEHAAYQESQQQLLAIQAEQQQNLAVARAESKASFENNQTLAQAAELGAISAAEAEQVAAAGAQAGTQLNPATQQILSKYGAGQPKFQRSQSHTQQVTKQNITINNNITSNTTNDVKVPANIGGPVQGRPLQFKDPSVAGGGSVGKFKSWISAAFSRQNEEGAKRDREYRNRESSLTKSANRMLKKLEEVGKTIGSRMDPRKIGSTWQSQLKTLLFLFGFGYLTSNWTKILKSVASIEKWFKNDFADFFGIGKGNQGKESGLKKAIRGILGGNENESLGESLKRLLYKGDESLYGYFKLLFKNATEERAKAIKMIKFPELDVDDLVGSIGKLGTYLGDVLSALVSGAEGAKNAVHSQIKLSSERGALEAMKNDSGTRNTIKMMTSVNGKQQLVDADKGMEALFKDPKTGKREHEGLTRYSLNEAGELTGSAESTYAQSVHLETLYQKALSGDKSFNTADAARGLERLYNAAIRKKEEEGHGIPIAKSFIESLSPKFLEKLYKEGKLKLVPYHRVVRKKTDLDYATEEADPFAMAVKAWANKTALDELGLGKVSDTIAGAKGASFGVAAGGINVLGAPARAYLGYKAGEAMNTPLFRGAKELLRGTINRAGSNEYRVEWERGKGADDNTIQLREISPEGIQDIANFLTNGAVFNKIGESQTNIDIKDQNFTDSVRSTFENIADTNLKNLKKDLYNAEARVKRTREKKDIDAAASIRHRVKMAETARDGIDDRDLQEYRKNIDELEELERQHKENEDAYWSGSRPAKSAENISNAVYEISGGEFGTGTEYLEAKEIVDNKDLMERKLYLFKLLKGKGLSGGAAAGIIGNLESEGLNRPTEDIPKNRVKDPTSKDSSAYSIGIAQFNSTGELPKLKEWAKKKGLNYNTFETQAQYIAEHPVISKILKETEGLTDQEALKKSAIIYGHDFEVFKGHNAADTKGNLVGRGDYQKVKINKNDAHRADGKLYGDENYAERIQKGLNTYSAYENADLTEIKIQSSKSNRQESTDESEEKEEEGEAKSFLEILKEKVTQLITTLGGGFGEINNRIADKVFPEERPVYTGPITRAFKSYYDYKACDEDDLPDVLPKGMTESEWRSKVVEVTGSMPINLSLREDSKEILEKYSKPEDWKNTEIPQYVSKVEENLINAKDDRYRGLIPYLEDPIMRNTLTQNEIANIERVKREDSLKESTEVAKVSESPEETVVMPEISPIEEVNNANFLSLLDPKNLKMKEDITRTIADNVEDIGTNIEKILAVNSITSTTSAHIVDAVNQGTAASNNASMNMARASAVRENNIVGQRQSLSDSNNSTRGIA